MWYDFFKVKPMKKATDYPFESRLSSPYRLRRYASELEYMMSVNTSEIEAIRICRERKLKFQTTFLTLREEHSIGFIDLPPSDVQWAPVSMPDSIFRDTCR